MKSRKEIRCPVHGKLLCVIIDDEYIELYCSKCKKKYLYKLPKNLTSYIPSGRIVLK